MSPSLCDCSWFDEETDPIQPCGCGKEQIRLYRDTVFHYEGKHWRSVCLIEHLWEELEKNREKDC